MERSSLKNIIILILALVNLFLLGSLVLRLSENHSAAARTKEELTERFAANGVTLSLNALPMEPPPSARALERSTDADREVAAFLLGDSLTVSDEGGGIYTYAGGSGQAIFRSNGSFEVTGRLSGARSPEECLRSFCKAFGYRDISGSLSPGSGSVTAVQYCEKIPVYGASVTFRAAEGALVSVSGTHLPSPGAELSGDAMTAATALTRFLEVRRSGAVASQVSEISFCYMLQSTTSAPMSLVPAWSLSTDAGIFYVNCSTGNVTRS